MTDLADAFLRLAAMTDLPTIGQLIHDGQRSISFEFMPPRDEAGVEQLWKAIRDLEAYRPTFVSVTYGAGGSTRDTTVRVTGRIAKETTLTPMAHLTCVGRSRGDFSIGVAAFPEGHPSAESLDHDADVLVAKAHAGAEFAVTQMFFRAQDYFGLVERVRARGVDMPILPGIMPILNLAAIRRQGELIGTSVPDEIVARIQAKSDDPAAVRAEGIALAAELCEALLEGGAPGLHFYTLNRSKATLEVFAKLNVTV